MKTHLKFKESDKPVEMGVDQVISDIKAFLEDRKAILVDAKVSKNTLTFTKPDGTEGTAELTQVADDFMPITN